MAKLSDKQYKFIKQSSKKFNIAHGGVRGGKNYCINIRLLHYFLREPENQTSSLFAFLGKTKASIERNVLMDFSKIVKTFDPKGFYYNENKGFGKIFNRPFQIFHYKDKTSMETFSGATAGGYLLNEACYASEDVLDECIRRSSIAGSLGFIDTNPSNPYHWLYKNYIANNELSNKYVSHFTYKDNLSLSPDYIDTLLSTHKPGSLKYRRMVMGEWVAGEGAIYDMFDPSVHVTSLIPGSFPVYLSGIDYGTTNPFCNLKIGVLHYQDQEYYFVLDEYYYDYQETNKKKTDDQYLIDISFFNSDIHKPIFYVDPAAANFSEIINQKLGTGKYDSIKNFSCIPAYNDISYGIDIISILLNQKRLFISSKCVNLIRQMSNYSWDKRYMLKGIDKPLKFDDHAVDALRYAIASHEKNKPESINNIYIETLKDYSIYG